MIDPADGGPAFPLPNWDSERGMSLLDHYAGKAMEQNLRFYFDKIGNLPLNDKKRTQISEEAYLMAEKMIEVKIKLEENETV